MAFPFGNGQFNVAFFDLLKVLCPIKRVFDQLLQLRILWFDLSGDNRNSAVSQRRSRLGIP